MSKVFLKKKSVGVTLFKSKNTQFSYSQPYKFLKDVYPLMLNLAPDTAVKDGILAFENFDSSFYPPKTSSQIYYSTFEKIYKILTVDNTEFDID